MSGAEVVKISIKRTISVLVHVSKTQSNKVIVLHQNNPFHKVDEHYRIESKRLWENYITEIDY
jgi:hypothetical protein